MSSDASALVEEVELSSATPANAVQLLTLVGQVQQILEASIVQTAGSWDKGIIITIALEQPTPLAYVMDTLEKMRDVEKVEEKPAARDELPSFPKESTSVPRPKTGSRIRILVTMKQVPAR
ncbi:MAG: hypothetical protein ACE5IA_04520 [Dehalococcoidia bacterium]